jgi:methionyl-tRNA synthetase
VILTLGEELLARTRTAYDNQAFNKALEGVWEVVSAGNRYIDEQAPWALRKTDPERMATVLYTLLEVIRRLAIVMQPVVPTSAGRMLDQLSVPTDARDFAHFGTDYKLTPGTSLPKPEPIFPRYVEAE